MLVACADTGGTRLSSIICCFFFQYIAMQLWPVGMFFSNFASFTGQLDLSIAIKLWAVNINLNSGMHIIGTSIDRHLLKLFSLYHTICYTNCNWVDNDF
jgi:hypothetical protein